MNFLALVNRAISESKQTIDPLTSATFSNPERTVLYNRLKDWISQAYLDLFEERREWFFSTERGVVTIQPRLHLANIDPGYTPTVGDVLTGDISGVVFTITEVFTDNEGDDTGDEATISVEYDKDLVDPYELKQWETVSAQRGLTDYPSIARIEGRGRYKLEQYISSVDKVDMNSVTIKPSVLDPDFDGTPSIAAVPLRYVDWPTYLRNYENFYSNLGQPRFVTRTSTGDLEFFPRPDGMYDVSFDYEAKATPLVNYNDIPSLLPEKHHLILVWMALKELADFNGDARLYARANKKYQERLEWLMRDNLPEMKFDTSRFDW